MEVEPIPSHLNPEDSGLLWLEMGRAFRGVPIKLGPDANKLYVLSKKMTTLALLDAQVASLWQRMIAVENRQPVVPIGEQPVESDVIALKSGNEALKIKVELLEASLKSVSMQLAALDASVQELVGTRKDEIYYQELLERELGGKHLHIAGVGITDITTPDAHIEIKRWRQWKEALGQLTAYQNAVPRRLSCVYFFGPRPGLKSLTAIADCMMKAGVEMYSFASNDAVEHHEIVEGLPQPLSPMQAFVEAHLVKDRGCTVTWLEVKAAFCDKYPDLTMTRDELRAQLASQGLIYIDTVIGGVKFRGFRGWRFKNTEQPNEVLLSQH